MSGGWGLGCVGGGARAVELLEDFVEKGDAGYDALESDGC